MKKIITAALGLAFVLSFNVFADTAQCPAKEVCDKCKSECVSADGTPTGHCSGECKPCKDCAPKE
jgi:hypothetical protein